MDPHSSGRTARSLETLHALGYFVPEVEQEITALGVRRGRGAYFASRAAAMGRVGPGPVVATFFVFAPSLVEHFVPTCWEAADPEQVMAARYRGIDAAYRRLLGDGGPRTPPRWPRRPTLARTAAAGCTPEGRALYAAHADQPWPDEPHLVLFHALTLIREHRGDGHVATTLAHGLSGLESLVTHTATGTGFTVPAAQATRGWSEEQWQACVVALADRGLMGADGTLTEGGVALRTAIETDTDERGHAPWAALGDEGTERLRTLGRPWVKQMVAGGVFPPGVLA